MSSIIINSVSSTTPRLQSVATLFSYSLILQPGAYGYSSSLDAYLSLNSSLSQDVYSGHFTYIVESMSGVPIYSSYYSTATSNYIHFAPFPYPVGSPTTGNSTFNTLSVSGGAQANSKLEYVYIAVPTVITVAFVAGLMWYLWRRSIQRAQISKLSAAGAVAGMHLHGEVIPEDGDVAEWGTSAHHFQLSEDTSTNRGNPQTFYEW